MREIKFRAFIPALKTMFSNIDTYQSGWIGINEKHFQDQLSEDFSFWEDEIRTRLSEDGESGYELIKTVMTGDEYLWFDDGFHLMQFTGLRDKNGVEIYEGDILETPHYIDENVALQTLKHRVSWSDKYTGWMIINVRNGEDESGTSNGNCQAWVYAKGENFEVIGNIYQNPELLSNENH